MSKTKVMELKLEPLQLQLVDLEPLQLNFDYELNLEMPELNLTKKTSQMTSLVGSMKR